MKERASLQEQVEAALSAIIGMPIWGAGRAVNMEMFDIGDRVEKTSRYGETIQVGAYAIHVQCPWRVIGPEGIAVGSIDAHYPPSVREGDESFDSNNDSSLCEEKMSAWLERRGGEPLFIRSVAADESGGFRLGLSGGYSVDVMPASSRPDYEHWRLIGPGTGRRTHFVVAGRNVV